MCPIAPADITSMTLDLKADGAQGVVAFEVSDHFQGKLHYKAEKKEGQWTITEYSLPVRKIRFVKAGAHWKIKRESVKGQ